MRRFDRADSVFNAHWDGDGKWVAIAKEDGSIQILDPYVPRPIHIKHRAHNSCVNVLRYAFNSAHVFYIPTKTISSCTSVSTQYSDTYYCYIKVSLSSQRPASSLSPNLACLSPISRFLLSISPLFHFYVICILLCRTNL